MSELKIEGIFAPEFQARCLKELGYHHLVDDKYRFTKIHKDFVKAIHDYHKYNRYRCMSSCKYNKYNYNWRISKFNPKNLLMCQGNIFDNVDMNQHEAKFRIGRASLSIFDDLRVESHDRIESIPDESSYIAASLNMTIILNHLWKDKEIFDLQLYIYNNFIDGMCGSMFGANKPHKNGVTILLYQNGKNIENIESFFNKRWEMKSNNPMLNPENWKVKSIFLDLMNHEDDAIRKFADKCFKHKTGSILKKFEVSTDFFNYASNALGRYMFNDRIFAEKASEKFWVKDEIHDVLNKPEISQMEKYINDIGFVPKLSYNIHLPAGQKKFEVENPVNVVQAALSVLKKTYDKNPDNTVFKQIWNDESVLTVKVGGERHTVYKTDSCIEIGNVKIHGNVITAICRNIDDRYSKIFPRNRFINDNPEWVPLAPEFDMSADKCELPAFGLLAAIHYNLLMKDYPNLPSYEVWMPKDTLFRWINKNHLYVTKNGHYNNYYDMINNELQIAGYIA